MALIDSEGFGFSAVSGDYLTYGVLRGANWTISTGGPFGDNYFNIGNTNGGSPIRNLPSSATTFFTGCRVNLVTQSPNTVTAFYFCDISGNAQLTMTFNITTGIISVYRGSTAVFLGSTASVLPASGWRFVEFGATIHSSSGTVTVKVDGVTVLNLAGQNTQGYVSSTTVGLVNWASQSASYNGCSIAHWYFCDDSGSAPWNTFLGDVRVQTVFPTSNDAVQFTPVGLASNWQNAAKVPPVPAVDYNSDTVVGHQDTFNCGASAAGVTSVYGVHVKALFQKTDAGARSMQTVLKSGVTTDLGPSTAISSSTQQVKKIYQTDPNTSAQWTLSNANAAQPGYKISA